MCVCVCVCVYVRVCVCACASGGLAALMYTDMVQTLVIIAGAVLLTAFCEYIWFSQSEQGVGLMTVEMNSSHCQLSLHR